MTSSEKSHAYSIQDEMPLGKYKGTVIETIIRAEPKYMAWLVSESGSFTLDVDAQELLNAMLDREGNR